MTSIFGKKKKNGECELRQHNFMVLNELFQGILLGSANFDILKKFQQLVNTVRDICKQLL